MLYFIREIKEKGLVKGHGNFPVYIDSPLAIEATRIFKDTDRTALMRTPALCWKKALIRSPSRGCASR